MKRIFALLLFVSAMLATCGQNRDSLNFSNASWRERYEDGIFFFKHQFIDDTLFDEPQFVYFIVVPPDQISRIHFGYDSTLTETSVQAKRHGALAAVNGSFFDMRRGNPVCYLKIDDNEVGENTPQKEDSVNRKYYQFATICLSDSMLHFVIPDSDRFDERRLPFHNVMTAGPMLIYNDSIIPQRPDKSFVTSRHNRTAIGSRADGSAVILVADGRFKGQATGLTLEQLTNIMKWAGCRNAINLDGGGSSTFYLRPQKYEHLDGVRNYPSDNGKFDHKGERPVSNIIYIK